jgi:hypothetical protein
VLDERAKSIQIMLLFDSGLCAYVLNAVIQVSIHRCMHLLALKRLKLVPKMQVTLIVTFVVHELHC